MDRVLSYSPRFHTPSNPRLLLLGMCEQDLLLQRKQETGNSKGSRRKARVRSRASHVFSSYSGINQIEALVRSQKPGAIIKRSKDKWNAEKIGSTLAAQTNIDGLKLSAQLNNIHDFSFCF